MSLMCRKAVAKTIREMRKKKRLRQIDVGVRTGITYRHYQEIEAGRVNMTLDTLWKLAKALGVRVATLLAGCD